MIDTITFVSHTNKPGGGELALRRYLDATNLPVRLVTMVPGGVWEGLGCEILHARHPLALRRHLAGDGLLIANSMRAAFWAGLVAPRNARLVYWVRDGLTDSAMSPLALAATKHITARRACHYLANSEWTADTVREALKVGREKVDVVYSMCGVRASDLARPPRPAPIGDPLRLLFLGRLSPWKAPHVAVQAIPHLRELGICATITIAGAPLFGEDDYASQLARLEADEPAANLVGHVENVRHLLASHDILIHCSTRPEPFGQVVVQGLSAGIPVVATAAGGPAEILGPSPVNVMYQPGDSVGLASAIQRSVDSYFEFSRWALKRADSYTDERAASVLDTVLHRLNDALD